VKIIYFSIL